MAPETRQIIVFINGERYVGELDAGALRAAVALMPE
jgi:hypothetical protein